MLESLVADKSGGKRTLRKDIDSQVLTKIEEFHKVSFNWNYLLNVVEITDSHNYLTKHEVSQGISDREGDYTAHKLNQ